MADPTGGTSIVLRVRRVIIEDAYISVPVTDAILNPEPDGTLRLDFEAFVREAIAIASSADVDWCEEDRQVEAHPTQGPVPAERVAFVGR